MTTTTTKQIQVFALKMTLTLENENRVGDSDGDESDLIGDESEDDAEEQSEEQSEDEDEEEDRIIRPPVLLAGQEWDDQEILRLKCLSGQLAILKSIWLTITGDDEDPELGLRGSASLRFFEWLVRSNVSERSFDKLRMLLVKERFQTVHAARSSRRKLANELSLYTQRYDCCIQNCMAFTGEHRLRRRCINSKCKAPRFHGGSADQGEYFTSEEQFANMTPQASYTYLPIIPRLKLLYANPEWSQKMRYPRSMLNEPSEDGIADVWEGKKMQDLKHRGTADCSVSQVSLTPSRFL
jgi:hypothetical protein